ncbi:GlxA family transcriptional regulator [Geobacter sp. SVR]|uniref:GlxA family transcriptional regulator n=1 Tax=Geobacter sp. SVR TaxID=2495594 RepID=UPI00143EFCF1|nr:GlxA family transcriptional regulator [Geobacter sp. SVR]BCS52796.1 transcriptional regulator [Geobacter sp. SVR]GCF86662.1 AraC family transcriptional regulator [Geobacter sp. SVR]
MKAHNTDRAVDDTARTIAIVIYDGCEILDATAPVEVFEMANRILSDQGAPAGYRMVLVAEQAGHVATSSGVRLVADHRFGSADGIDTLIVAGSPDEPLYRAVANETLVGYLRDFGPRVRRLVSVCAGAFILAEAGMLDGRRATTHWMDAERLAQEYPSIRVEPDAIFVRDGSIATSAGVTAGLDLALALVEEDFGKRLALAVARRLVMYLKRPGGQTQFSTHLRNQMVNGGSLSAALTWLESNFRRKISVVDLAERACMSPRNFARTFLRETHTTPARYIEQLRLEHAVRLLEDTTQPLAVIAAECGFASTEQLRRAFHRNFGIGPAEYRERF